MTELMLGSILDLGKNAFISSNADSAVGENRDFTLSCWIHINAIDEQANIISKQSDNQLIYALRLYRDNNQNHLALNVGASSQTLTLSAPIANLFSQWVHVAFTIENSANAQVCLFVNGECLAQDSLQAHWQDNTAALQIGRGLNGHIFDVRRWQQCLNPEQIQAWSTQWMTGTETDLHSWLPLTQSVGLNEATYHAGESDNSGAVSGTLEGTLIEWQNEDLPVVIPNISVLHLDQQEAHFSVPNVENFPQNRFTLEFWYRSYHATSQSVVMEYVGNDAQRTLGVKVSNPLALTLDIAGAQLQTDVNLVTGRWTHVAITWNKRDGKTRIFINGEAQGSQVRIAPAYDLPTSGSLFVGADHTLKAPAFAAYLSDFRLWKTGRSHHEINNNRLFRLEGDEYPLFMYYPLSQQEGNHLDSRVQAHFDDAPAWQAKLVGGRWEQAHLVIQPSAAEQLRTLRARAALYQPPVEDEDEPSKGEPVANIGLAFETKDLINDFAEQLAQVQSEGFVLNDVKLEASVLLSTESNKVIIPYLSTLEHLDPKHYSKIELNFSPTPRQADGQIDSFVAPNLVGNTQTFAETQLVNAGIAFETLHQAVSDAAQQGVVIQQQPNPGAELAPSKPLILIIGTSYNV